MISMRDTVHPASPVRQVREGDPSPGPVFVVDDDEAVRNALKFALELEGHEVRVYKGGREMLAEVEAPLNGCLVVDYYMPGMTGLDLVEALHRRAIDLPVILISAKLDGEMRSRAALSGIRAVLEKPLSDEALFDGVRSALGAA